MFLRFLVYRVKVKFVIFKRILIFVVVVVIIVVFVVLFSLIMIVCEIMNFDIVVLVKVIVKLLDVEIVEVVKNIVLKRYGLVVNCLFFVFLEEYFVYVVIILNLEVVVLVIFDNRCKIEVVMRLLESISLFLVFLIFIVVVEILNVFFNKLVVLFIMDMSVFI